MTNPLPHSNRVDQWIFQGYAIDARALGLYRVLYASFLLIWGLPNFEWIAGTLPSFFNPPTHSFPNLLTGVPPYWFLQGLSLLVVVLCILLLFGWRTRWVSIALFVAIVVGKSFSYSFGQIGKDLILWLVPLVMSFSNWGAHYSMDARNSTQSKTTHSWPVTFMALLLGFGMFSAGLPKLLGGWLNVATHATRSNMFMQHYVVGDMKLLSSAMVSITNPILWELMDWGAVIFELLFLVAIINRQWFRSLLLFALVFHTLAFLMFDISYYTHYIIYLLFIDWGKISDSVYQVLQKVSVTLLRVKWLISMVAIYLPAYIIAQHLLSMPALLDVSPFYIPAEVAGCKHEIVMGLTALPIAWAVGIWQLATTKNNRNLL